MSSKMKVVIVGGGTGGITVAARLVKKMNPSDIMLIEPNDTHYYQPMWTLVGAGICSTASTGKPVSNLIPAGVKWLKDKVVSFDAGKNSLTTEGGKTIEYEFLVLSPGVQLDIDKTEGLRKALEMDGVSTNFDGDSAEKTWRSLNNFKGGKAVFIMPPMPIKCPGAPQKIMWLADDLFRKKGIRDKCEIYFITTGGGMFGIPHYNEPLQAAADERGIKRIYMSKVTKIDGDAKKITLTHIESGEIQEMDYDYIHTVPIQSAPDFIKQSPFTNEEGWIDVDKHTMQSTKFKNVFALGDACSTPNSKTGAAIRKQAPVLVDNLMAQMANRAIAAHYDGYASCPLVMSYSTCMLAEFGYDGKLMETFPFAQNKPRKSMYILKKNILPVLYWEGMMKGRA